MLICNVTILCKVICLARMRNNNLQECGGQPHDAKRQKRLNTVSRRIIILSTTYLICNAPLCIFIVLKKKNNIVSIKHELVYTTVFSICMFLNNGVNFLLYCLIGSGFRKYFIGLFKSENRSSTFLQSTWIDLPCIHKLIRSLSNYYNMILL